MLKAKAEESKVVEEHRAVQKLFVKASPFQPILFKNLSQSVAFSLSGLDYLLQASDFVSSHWHSLAFCLHLLSSVHLAYLPGEIAGKCEQICRNPFQSYLQKCFSVLSSEILLSLIFHVLSGPREPVCKNALYSLFHVLLHKIGEASEEITHIIHTGKVEVLIEVFIKTGAQLNCNWKKRCPTSPIMDRLDFF